MEAKAPAEAKHYRLEAYRQRDDGLKSTIIYYDVYCELWEAARIMADVIIRELHDGDGENGGRGPLTSCYGEIIDYLICDLAYTYADCEFNIYPIYGVDDYFKK